jgi:hypothetical protein
MMLLQRWQLLWLRASTMLDGLAVTFFWGRIEHAHNSSKE